MKRGVEGHGVSTGSLLVAVVAPHQKFDAFVSLVTSIVRPLCFDFLATSRQYCKSPLPLSPVPCTPYPHFELPLAPAPHSLLRMTNPSSANRKCHLYMLAL